MPLTKYRTHIRDVRLSEEAADLRFAPPTLLLQAHGVTFNAEPNDYYIETCLGFDRQGLRMALTLAGMMGLEVMDEDECPGEILPHGRVRLYLVDVVLTAA